MTSYTINEEFNGIEITFSSKPEAATRDTLKSNGFRWHRKKALWYAKNTPDRLAVAESIGAIEDAHKYAQQIREEEKPAPAYGKGKKKPANKYGVKVGDLFHASWGYEQTNNDFFQVVELVGSSSVRVREVNPVMENEEAVSSMSADRTYKVSRDILPPCSSSIFIEDQERGDLKRLKSYQADGVSNPEIKIGHTRASLVTGESIKVYDSWYY